MAIRQSNTREATMGSDLWGNQLWRLFRDSILQFWNAANSLFLSITASMFIQYIIPLILLSVAVIVRASLIARYKGIMKKCLTDEQRDLDLANNDNVVWIGIVYQQSLALVAASSALKEFGIKAEPIIFYVRLSFIAFNASNSLKSYKFTYLHQQIGEIFEHAARMLFLTAIVVTAWQGSFDTVYLYAITALAIGGWLVDYSARYILWSNYFKDLLDQAEG